MIKRPPPGYTLMILILLWAIVSSCRGRDDGEVQTDDSTAEISDLQSKNEQLKSDVESLQKLLEACKELSTFNEENRGLSLGVSRQDIMDRLNLIRGIDYSDGESLDGKKYVEASAGGVRCVIWGAGEDAVAVTLIGMFDGELGGNTGLMLSALTSAIVPDWDVDEMTDWFSKAKSRSDEKMNVSTDIGDIKVMVVTAPISGHKMRVISFTNPDED